MLLNKPKVKIEEYIGPIILMILMILIVLKYLKIVLCLIVMIMVHLSLSQIPHFDVEIMKAIGKRQKYKV